eukprot:UN21111
MEENEMIAENEDETKSEESADKTNKEKENEMDLNQDENKSKILDEPDQEEFENPFEQISGMVLTERSDFYGARVEARHQKLIARKKNKTRKNLLTRKVSIVKN